MEHAPGVSWGPDKPVNLIEFNGRWYALYCHPDGFREIIKDFGPIQNYLPPAIFRTMALWNYGTCKLCSVVKMEMDATS